MDDSEYVPIVLDAITARELRSEARASRLGRSALVKIALAAFLPEFRRARLRSTKRSLQSLALAQEQVEDST
jgi:hypothetical protein